MKVTLPALALIASLSSVFGGSSMTSPTPCTEPFKAITTRSVAATRIAGTPDYVHTLSADANWLDFGFESRTRYEYRWNDYTTPTLITDDALVTRNLLYFGIKNVLDPIRFVLEMEDSRRFLSDRAENAGIEDHLEPLQAYAQLHFDDAIDGAPLSLSFGRMAFDAVDRRLISRNRNRNTINAFDGVRLRLGDEWAPWEVDAFAMRPMQRSIDNFDDESDSDSMFYGVSGYFRDLSPDIVIEPYWLWLDQRDVDDVTQRKNVHTFGLHAYGQWGEGKRWDYDVSVAGQFGSVQARDQRALAGHVEAGYTFSSAWKPRLGLWLNYASGDEDPKDGSNERFDPLFGASYAFYGYTSYFTWQNMLNPALRLSFSPAKKLKCELMHRAIWLASYNDAWVKAARRDTTRGGGSYIGQETDMRISWQVLEYLNFDLAYAHFFAGDFTDDTGSSPDSNFVQIAATLTF